MLKIPKNLYSLPTEELADYLIKNFSVYDIATATAELLKGEEEVDKISITYSQFRRFFKVRGLAANSPFVRENRGRKPLSEKAIANAEKRDSELFNDKEDEDLSGTQI